MYIPDPRWEEPNLLIPGKKPVGPVKIDWTHALGKGLAFGQLYGAGEPELVTGEHLGSLAGTASLGGDSVVVEGGNGWINLGSPEGLKTSNSSSWTFGIVFLCTSSSFSTLIGRSVSTAGNRYLRIAPFVSATQTQWLQGAGVWGDRRFAVNPEVNEIQVGCFSSEYKMGVLDKTRALYSNGEYVELIADFADWASQPEPPSGEWQLGTEESGGVGAFRGKLYALFKWERALTKSEMEYFVRNPYQFLIPA